MSELKEFEERITHLMLDLQEKTDQKIDSLREDMKDEFYAVRFEMEQESNRICNRIDILDDRVQKVEDGLRDISRLPEEHSDRLDTVETAVKNHSDRINKLENKIGIA